MYRVMSRLYIAQPIAKTSWYGVWQRDDSYDPPTIMGI